MKTITLKCDNCQQIFDKPLKEYTRNQKRGMVKNFCSLSCFACNRNASMTDDYWKEQYEKQKKSFDIKSKCGNRQDTFSPFRFCIGSGRASIIAHKDGMDIDLPYLKWLWEKQNGICPYTGLKMVLSKNTRLHGKLKSLQKASLDRIDSSKGYIKGNVEFVCMGANLAKVNHSKQSAMEFFTLIKKSTNQDTLSITQTQPT